MRYREAVALLLGLTPRAMQPGLSRVQSALALRGHPERGMRTILVGGTNGKGSVTAMVAAGLTASGHRVGRFTSPHLHRLTERFRIGPRQVSERRLAEKVSELAPLLTSSSAPQLSFFEACTLVAIELFRDAGCELAVLEVGLGGRLDATNAIAPCLSVITSVALDHEAWLGSTLAQIAGEKAGIIWPETPVVCGVRAPDARAVVSRRARSRRATLRLIDRDFSAAPSVSGYRVSVGEQVFPRVHLPLRGGYQADNLACAMAALVELSRGGLRLDHAAVLRALSRLRWPGRLELLKGAPSILLDAAHNPEACAELGKHLAELRAQFSKVALVFGVLRDKDHRRMLPLLAPHVDFTVFSEVPVARARAASDLLQLDKSAEVASSPLQALRRARRRAGRKGLVVVAGSIFLLAQIRAFALDLRADPPVTL